jgi:hypothetical protein
VDFRIVEAARMRGKESAMSGDLLTEETVTIFYAPEVSDAGSAEEIQEARREFLQFLGRCEAWPEEYAAPGGKLVLVRSGRSSYRMRPAPGNGR